MSLPGGPAPRIEDYSHLPSLGRKLVAGLQNRVAELAGRQQVRELLEVGCGQGWLLKRLAEEFPDARLTGLDVREDALGLARELVPSANLLLTDGRLLPFEDSAFDVVVCVEVLEHVPEPAEMLTEIRRVTRSAAVISTPWEPWFTLANLARGAHLATLGNCPGHINHWSRRGLRRLLEAHFGHVEVETSLPWLVAYVSD